MTLDCTGDSTTASDEFALTPLQLGMVYESVLADRSWVNLEQIVVHLDDEDVDANTLRDAWALIARRHAALRIQVLSRGRETPVQVVAPDIEIDFIVENWKHLSDTDQEERLTSFLESDRLQGFDLEKNPSWRVAFLDRGESKSTIVWTIHHLLVDGRSIAIVLEELFQVLAGRGLADAPGQTDFATFCRVQNTCDTFAARQYFQDAMSGFDQPNQLSVVGAGPHHAGRARMAVIEHGLDADHTAALVARARLADATLANLVHAAWGLVVARWSGRADAVFGATRSGRFMVPGTERLVGCLINTLPVRVDAAPTRTLDDLLKDIRAASVAMRPHEHASLGDIRRWIGFSGTAPLFESLVMFERSSMTGTMRRIDPAWQRRRVELREEGGMPITLAVYGEPQMQIVFEHDPDLIPAGQAQAMLRHFTGLLDSMARSVPGAPLSSLTMLSPDEEAELQALARPDGHLPQAVACLAARFEAAVAERPANLALTQVGADASLDFQTLDRRANGLAHRLVAEGAGPGQIVAICLERSPEFVVAMLAILKVGAAFLPVDPAYPRRVIEHMLSDSGARLMVSDGRADCPHGLLVLSPNAAPEDVPPARPAPDPDRLAYVIYTSGSTGMPKGVRIPQRAVSAHVSAMIDAFDLTESDRCLQFASLSFDVSIEESIPTLIAGAGLVLRNARMAESIAGFLEAVDAMQLTVLNLPTAFWHILVDDLTRSGRSLPGCVRLVIVGGERINPRSLAKWQRIAPNVRWLNGYGPTETTITCTLHEPGPVSPDEDIPIGRPTLHARAHILAADGSLAPRGCEGDLWIAGPAVGDGYIGLDAQTAQAFRPDPFSGQGAMYRTGDRACWRPDGTLAFLGRQDRQVKLRGFRIDLRQIETVCERQDGVGRALVRVLDADGPAARLLAWVTGDDGASLPDADALSRAVARSLPPHMVPTIMVVPEFPRTPGGKIDTDALPVPEIRPEADRERAASEPASPKALRVAALMARLLRIDSVGPDDSFHDLGGHSLLAVQLIGQIEAEFGLRLGVGDLHRNPTPRGLCEVIESAHVGPRYIIPIRPEGALPPLFGVHVLGHNEVYYRPLAQLLGPEQPVLGLTVGLLTKDTPVGVEATAQCYFDEIQHFYPDGPVALAAVSLGSYIAFELARLLHHAGREVRMLALFDAEGPAGRPRVTGANWLKAHASRLRRHGAGHMRQVLANRFETLRNGFVKRKLIKASDNGDAAPMTLSAFVAANELAVRAYEARPIEVPLTIFRAQWDVFDSPEGLRNGLGWGPVARAGFRVIDVPGDHLSILETPNVEHLAGHIRRAMAG